MVEYLRLFHFRGLDRTTPGSIPAVIHTSLLDGSLLVPREHEGTERDTEGLGCDKLFLVSGSLFSPDVRTDYNLDLRCLVNQ